MARAFVIEHICHTHRLPPVEDAILLTSEAITNAVIHGAPPIELAIDCTGSASEIRVSDGSTHVPQPKDPADDDVHGRGLVLIDVLSDAWGVDTVEPGKQVWFLLSS
jgi:anti-sigma regulatory factor (Ser/Thr protein kinase)